MSEVYWPETDHAISFSYNTLLAQTFMPLWSHTCDHIRVKPGFMLPHHIIEVSIQALKLDGTPTGARLTWIIIDFFESWGVGTYGTVQKACAPIRLVVGHHYALVFRQLITIWPTTAQTLYDPPPSGYPRGKLIRSTDGGSTWDTTDLGDIVFGEWGDPPIPPNPWVTPIDHWAAVTLGTLPYSTSACIRISTSEPVYAVCHVTENFPHAIYRWRTERGVRRRCFSYYAFVEMRSYRQLEKWDSIYHTFHIKKLKEGEKYWFTFTAESDFTLSSSISPLVKRVHPGGPPFTTLRRPDAPGDFCLIDWQIGDPCPNHYLNVDEASSDEEETLVATRYSEYFKRDLYHIPPLDISHAEAPFEQLHITARWRRQGGMAYVHIAKIGIKVNGVEWWTSAYNQIGTDYENEHLHLYENPITGLPWTYAELNSLQIGVALRHYRGVGWGSYCACTQLYCRIIHDCSAYE